MRLYHYAKLLPMLVALLGTSAMAAEPPTAGTISIDAPDLYRDAASEALANKGFTPLDGAGHAAWTMVLTTHVSDVGTGSARVAPTQAEAIKGGLGRGVGSGIRIPVPSAKSRFVALQRTELTMTLRRRGNDKPIWRGTAVTVRPDDPQGRTAADLCNALLRAYPAQPDAIIGVP